LIPLALFGLALLARFAVGAAFPGPAYPDSYYYVHVAQQLVAGHGFVADYVWNLDDVGRSLLGTSTLPVPANGLWMPLAEIVQLPFIWLFGPAGSGVAFWLIGACAAPLTYWIGRDAGFSRRSAVVAGAMTAVPAALLPLVTQPDNYALFMVLGPASMWLCARGMRGNRRSFAIGGAVVGLATLARADGILLGLPFALAFAIELLRRRDARIGWMAATVCVALFVAVLAPWLWRQHEVYGTWLPGASSGRLIWLTDYGQLFSAANPPSAAGWVAQGAPQILFNGLGGLASAVELFALTALAGILAPFAVVGALSRRSDPAFWPFFVYALALFAVMGLVFPVVVTHGTFMHSASALVPYAYLLVVAGVERSVHWVAARRKAWDPLRASRLFSATAVVVALIAAGTGTVVTVKTWADVQNRQRTLAAALSEAPASDRFMAPDPGAINYLTGRQGVLTPDDSLPVIEDVMRSYQVRWLVVDRQQLVPALEPLLDGTIKPDWLSHPLATISGASRPVATTGVQPPTFPDAAIYAVCFAPDDSRCE
jgi:hypothetical protein